MGKKIGKAREIFDAKIQFVSLVDAAANKRKFLLTKAKDGTCSFVNYGRILKADPDSHYVTGIVYEPMTEDTDGEFMTAEEIRKAAYYYVKNFENVDIQHSFEPEKNCAVVESWIAKADFSIGNEAVKEGTWLMTVEVSDEDLWEKISKGEITGFSMGGICMSSEEEVELPKIEKSASGTEDTNEKKGLLAKLASFLGFEVTEKGEMADLFTERVKNSSFWAAFDSLSDTLRKYDPSKDSYVYETDEEVIKGALEDFGGIINGLLKGTQPLAKAIEGLPGSGAEKTITEKEEKEVTRAEAEEIVAKSIAEALSKEGQPAPEAEQPEDVAKGANTEKAEEQPEEITAETLSKMVAEAVEKAKAEQVPEEPQITMKDIQDLIAVEVAKAVEPIRKANHLPSALDSLLEKSGNQPEEHYLHGIL